MNKCDIKLHFRINKKLNTKIKLLNWCWKETKCLNLKFFSRNIKIPQKKCLMILK